MTRRLNGASDSPEPAQTAMDSIGLLISGVASCTTCVRQSTEHSDTTRLLALCVRV
jgi:hypothetical protein